MYTPDNTKIFSCHLSAGSPIKLGRYANDGAMSHRPQLIVTVCKVYQSLDIASALRFHVISRNIVNEMCVSTAGRQGAYPGSIIGIVNPLKPSGNYMYHQR
jgi:hypothetical protein